MNVGKLKGIRLSPRHMAAIVSVVTLGCLGAYTFSTSSVGAASTCVANTYRLGSSGTCVRYAQTMLNNVNFNIHNMGTQVWEYSVFGAPLAVDGSYGPKTTAAVKAYQTFNNSWRYTYNLPERLAVDSELGPHTWKSLCSAGKYINTHNHNGLMPSSTYFINGYFAGVNAGCRSIVTGY